MQNKNEWLIHIENAVKLNKIEWKKYILGHFTTSQCQYSILKFFKLSSFCFNLKTSFTFKKMFNIYCILVRCRPCDLQNGTTTLNMPTGSTILIKCKSRPCMKFKRRGTNMPVTTFYLFIPFYCD